MSHNEADDLTELLAEWGSREPPPLEPGQADDMVAAALAALDDDMGIAPVPSADTQAAAPPPANTGTAWWLRAALPLAAAAALVALGWQLARQQQPTQPEQVFAEQDAAPAEPQMLVIEGKAGMELAVREEQPVLLRMGPHELQLIGTGRLTIESIEQPRVHLRRGAVLAHWKTSSQVPLRLATDHGDVALEQGKGRLKVTDTDFSWQLQEGAAHLIQDAAPTEAAPPRPAPTPPKEAVDDSDDSAKPSASPTEPEPAPEGISEADAAEALYVRAETALAAGHDAEAIALLEQLVREHPDLPKAATALGDLSRLTRDADPARSRRYDQQLVRDYPNGMLADDARERLSQP